jgi:TRAP-type C4-dicarboxylate transport system substrate-binding protein
MGFLKSSIFLLLWALFTFPVFSEVKIKFASLAPEGTTWMKTMHAYDLELQKETSGRVQFIFFAGGVAGDEKDILRKMRYDKIHATGLTGVGMGQIVPETRILDLPFFFANDTQLDRVQQSLFDHFSKKFKDQGYRLISWSNPGWTYLFSSQNLDQVEGYSKLKTWSWEGDLVALEALKNMGITPITLPIADVLTSLQTGLLDTVYAPPLAAIALQWDSKVSFVLETPLVHSSGAMLITNKQFEKISPQDQAIFLKLGKKYISEVNIQTRLENQKALDDLKNKKLKNVPPTPSLKTLMGKVYAETQKFLTGKLFDTEALEKIIKIRDQAS